MAVLVFYFGGIVLAVVSPLWRRFRKAAAAVLATGACIVLGYALFDLAHPDVRIGRAAIESNRRFELLTLACELPVVILAVVSVRFNQKICYWLGWSINLAYGIWLGIIVIWLEFFWHW